METRTVGYKILFSTHLSHDEIEDAIDEFLRDVDAREMISQVSEMTDEEIHTEIKSFRAPN